MLNPPSVRTEFRGNLTEIWPSARAHIGSFVCYLTVLYQLQNKLSAESDYAGFFLSNDEIA
jgi:hypothetical protein